MTMLLNVRRKQRRAQRRVFRPTSSTRSKAHRSRLIGVLLVPLSSVTLTSNCLSVKASNTDNSDEDRPSSNPSVTSPSSPFDSFASSLTSSNVHEETLNDLGYLDHNEDNLLGYLKHVSTHLSSCPISTLTWFFW